MTGSELRRLRTRAGFSQRTLAAALGMHKNTIAQMERDELPIRTVVALAAVHVCSGPKPTKGGRHER
jgi:transcriptional regulator with XRE-family HTH domain